MTQRVVAKFWPAKITRGGALFTLALLLVGGAAALSANNLLFLILAAMLATLLISGLISRLCLAGLELELLLPEHISARSRVPAHLYLRNLKRWMASFSIHISGTPLTTPLYFPLIPGGANLEESAEVLFPKRGRYSENLFVFSTKFPFGFLEKTALVTLRRETVVYPSIEPQPGFEDLLGSVLGEIEMQHRGIGRDFYRIRPYEPLESARYVDWKSTAHTGDLQVREFAREQQRAVEIFLDRDVPQEHEEWFERAIDCCAFLAWQLSQHETAIRFRSQKYDVLLPEEGDVYTVLKYLALAAPQKGSPESPVDESNLQIVLTPAAHRFVKMGWNAARFVGLDSLAHQISAGSDLPDITSGSSS